MIITHTNDTIIVNQNNNKLNSKEARKLMKKKKNLTIEKLFSLLSNQKRLEILMAVFDN
ncbi:hypothetical protein [Fervidobacterium pennivorans]|uniref:hypothetical protein n=1 Tax=Fervidobacterium pennivorans TaxID=93466 RepID=UPI001BC894A3|nr:hypothetical protein [Fervidobacterium pennivorans]